MAAFKMGSFNIIVVTSVTTLCIAGIPTIPYYIRYLIHGEPPRRKDFFERYLEWRPAVWDKGAPYIFTRDYTYDVKAVESSWRSAHAAVGNAAPAVSAGEAMG